MCAFVLPYPIVLDAKIFYNSAHCIGELECRVLDYKRKFIEAASRYNELSYKTIIHEEERMTALKNAMICTILAAAGQQRSRMLATLYKDERCQQVIERI